MISKKNGEGAIGKFNGPTLKTMFKNLNDIEIHGLFYYNLWQFIHQHDIKNQCHIPPLLGLLWGQWNQF